MSALVVSAVVAVSIVVVVLLLRNPTEVVRCARCGVIRTTKRGGGRPGYYYPPPGDDVSTWIGGLACRIDGHSWEGNG